MSRTRLAAVTVLLGTFTLGCGRDAPTAQRDGDVESAGDALLNDRDGAGAQQVAMLDDCDPTDPSWGPTGGCTLRGGSVTNAEFGAFLSSPFSLSVVGHPAWRNEPSFLHVRSGKEVKVVNLGGRLHTFTPVAAFGGGRVPPLNQGLAPVPECALAPGALDPFAVPPGGRLRLDQLADGLQRYQCCIHPWMRAAIRISGHGH